MNLVSGRPDGPELTEAGSDRISGARRGEDRIGRGRVSKWTWQCVGTSYLVVWAKIGLGGSFFF